MKKLFLIPLMTLMCSVMAWATDAHVSSIADLNAKLADASVETIYLDADLTYTTEACINILRSVTIDGQGHKISGGGIRTGSTKSTMAINQGAPGNGNWIDLVTLKNITLQTSTFNQVLNCRGNITRLVIENSTIKSTYASGNNQSITFANASQSSSIELVINNSIIDAGNSGYPIISWNPLAIEANGSTFSGYCGLYFKAPNGTPGTRGSVVNADACNFECPNVHSGATNAFSCFPIADDGITLNLHNCGINNQQIGDQNQALVTIGNDGLGSNRHAQAINITISGDNSHINVGGGMNKTFQNLWGYGTNGYPSKDYNDFADINVTITGGTYSVHPQSYDMAAYGHWNIEDDQIKTVNLIIPTILPTDTVLEISQGDITLYRVVKKAQEKTPGVMYDLNDFVPVEGVDEGNNPISSFDLSTGTGMTLNNEVTTAGYVQVSDNEDSGVATTVTVGQTAGGDDQTLVINNGLDVQGNSQVIVESGATLQIGEGGINTEKPENIVIEANENGAASLLLDPAITVNQTPNLTVEMKVSQAGKDAYGDYWWHRFAMPVGSLPEAWAKSPNYGTYLYGWNYATNNWEQVAGGSTSMQPWKGYTLTYNEAYDEDEVVTYTFKGNLVGNTDAALTFEEEGYQFFGNSYTGYMDVLTLINQLTDGNIDKSVWMWNPGNQTYTAVPLEKLADPVKAARLKSWQKEVAPMQTFIMRLRGASSANETVSYADAIWGNPRYGNGGSGAGAPRRRVATADEAYMEIVVTAANGQSDRVDFTINSSYSDAFENGVDASKYMNERYINLYATVSGEDYTSVATDNIEGKTISLQTKNDLTYTISFENVETEGYALLDKLTNNIVVIAEGNTYEFAAQPNSVIEGRFEIVSRANMPTAIENTEVNANVKGIYTITGQYLGENFDILPAGVYVVNGVKIVK